MIPSVFHKHVESLGTIPGVTLWERRSLVKPQGTQHLAVSRREGRIDQCGSLSPWPLVLHEVPAVKVFEHQQVPLGEPQRFMDTTI